MRRNVLNSWIKDLEPQWREFKFTIYLLKQSPLVVAGFIIIFIFVIAAIFAPWIAPYGPEERIWTEQMQPPNLKHLFGTDENGGDIFSRIIWGARIDLSIALIVVCSAALLGSIIGSIAGYMGGKIDEALMRVTDVFLAFPGLILAMAIAAALGRNLTNLTIALIIVWWPSYARLIRGVVLSEREKLYVEAAKAIGAKNMRIIFRHILPNAIYPLLVNATLDLGSVILTAAGLSFIGFGAGAGIAEWGRMIADGRNYLFQAPWMATFPGLAILLSSLALNLIGDGLRDVLDPRLRR
ncbi:MAG: ABC transporter permease [Candidatus Bathyarchaeia archaeon]|nr:ABC transporter permease [Candidatus Bathyarchaeota archaeon]